MLRQPEPTVCCLFKLKSTEKCSHMHRISTCYNYPVMSCCWCNRRRGGWGVGRGYTHQRSTSPHGTAHTDRAINNRQQEAGGVGVGVCRGVGGVVRDTKKEKNEDVNMRGKWF